MSLNQAARKALSRKTVVAVPAAAEKPGTVGLVLVPVGKPTQDTAHANANANYGAGEVAGDMFIQKVKEQAGSLKMFLQDIAQGDQQYRKGFRVSLSGYLKRMSEALKGPNVPEDWKASSRSAAVRISEAKTFSRAIDAGMSWDTIKQGNYHAIIGAARLYLKGCAKGPTQRKARPAKPFLDKLRVFLDANVQEPADLDATVKLAAEMAAEMAE